MPVELPDINVLIALFDSRHVHHESAQAWYAALTGSWATCPITENGFLRIVSNQNYLNLRLSLPELAAGLRELMSNSHDHHIFLHDNISLCDKSLFDLDKVQGFRQLTDIYLTWSVSNS